MRCPWLLLTIVGVALLLAPATALGVPAPVQQLHDPETEVDAVGDRDGIEVAPTKTLQDTIWIADWTFDTGAPCSNEGWSQVDNHVLNDGVAYWHLETGFTTTTGMTGRSAALGYHGRQCCVAEDGYDNDWYQGIRMTYSGSGTLSLDYIVDSEAGFDFLRIETDSLCLSYARVDFGSNASSSAAAFRRREATTDGMILNGAWDSVGLRDYGPGTHCAYIAFVSNFNTSPCDGDQPTTVGEAAVVDNIVLVDGSGTRTEDFEDGSLDLGTFVNMADSKPFGMWARLFRHISDNDVCTENSTCAWLWTDDTTPTLFNDPAMAFGPGSYVTRNWLDDIIVGPWISIGSTPTATSTLLWFRRNGSNVFATGRIVQSWSVRSKKTVDGGDCLSGWGHASSWNSLSTFAWQSALFDMSPYFDSTAEAIQIRYRTSDWQRIGLAAPPSPFNPGPGPYNDRTRIGRVVLSGPVINEGIDSRSQAQDCFPSEINPLVTPAGQHFRPTTDRFGTCAFSEGTDLAINKRSANLVTGDSIIVNVRGIRPGGTIVTSITWSGAIVSGPHAGKAPPPRVVGANGFFTFNADSVRGFAGRPLANNYFVDLDDFYFRGGDALVYFWGATDIGGGYSSDPVGLSGPPASVAAAEADTRGLMEVNFLPTINWSPAYLARIAADPSGKLAPTTAELAASTQKNCILYVQNIATRRRSGDAQRTSFMYSLDRLGYRGSYDTFDHQGMGNTNNQLGGRATVQQCQGYSLIVYDNGNGTAGRPLLPDGHDLDSEKIDQASWFRLWLAQASLGEAQRATLWVISSNTVEEKSTKALISTNMGVTLTAKDQALHVNPDVDGVASFTFDTGAGTRTIDFSADFWPLNGGCPTIRNYDAIAPNGTAVQTHRYRSPITGALGAGAVVMNSNAAENWNTIMMTFPWFDIRDNAGTPAAIPPELAFLTQILGVTLPAACVKSPLPTDAGPAAVEATPARTALHANVPNPFNPTTTIRFDLAESGRVRLKIVDVAGHLVRVLLYAEIPAGRNHRVVWNGLDADDRPVASGVYFCRFEAPGASATRKLVVMR